MNKTIIIFVVLLLIIEAYFILKFLSKLNEGDFQGWGIT